MEYYQSRSLLSANKRKKPKQNEFRSLNSKKNELQNLKKKAIRKLIAFFNKNNTKGKNYAIKHPTNNRSNNYACIPNSYYNIQSQKKYKNR